MPRVQTQRKAEAGSPGTSRKPEQGMTLLSTRLSAPRLPVSLVQRERLLAELDGALSPPRRRPPTTTLFIGLVDPPTKSTPLRPCQ